MVWGWETAPQSTLCPSLLSALHGPLCLWGLWPSKFSLKTYQGLRWVYCNGLGGGGYPQIKALRHEEADSIGS